MKKKTRAKREFVFGIVIFIIIQSLIFLLFCRFFNESKPVDLEKIKSITVLVEEKTYVRVISEYRFGVISNDEEYLFANYGSGSKFSNKELYETINVGDTLSILFYEEKSILGNRKWVLEASSQTEMYRSMEEYYANKKGLLPIVLILFVLIELVFLSAEVGCFYFFKQKFKHKKKVDRWS